MQGVGTDLTEPSNSLASRTILAKRIIDMADNGLSDVTELRDDALDFHGGLPLAGEIRVGDCVMASELMLCAPVLYLPRTNSLVRAHDAINGMTLK